YITALELQKQAITYLGIDDDKYRELWGEGYTRRAMLIYTIMYEYGLNVKDQDALAEMVSTGKNGIMMEQTKSLFDVELKSLSYVMDKSSSYIKYKTVVNNRTSSTFSSANVTVVLFDKDGVEVESE